MTPDQNIIEKIKRLFALSESPNEAEAALAATKAHELLKKYNMSLSDLETATPSKVTLESHIAMTKLHAWRCLLGNHVASVNYCTTVRSKTEGYEVMCFIGRTHNIAAAKVMFDYLEKVVARLSRQLKDKRLNREKFRDGLVYGLGRRLKEVLSASSETSNALVVLNQEVDDFMVRLKPKTITVNNASDCQSFRRGYEKSKTVGLHRQISGCAS